MVKNKDNMDEDNFTIPILFLVFNRLDTAMQVFNSIKKIKPTRLYIAADGPRMDKNEEQICVEVQRAVLSGIDWACEVKTLFRKENLGCGIAVSNAITWFFEQEEMGIILEDDTVPDITFFNYCADLLNFYKEDDRVMHISGNQYAKNKLKCSYYFSKLPFIWGWATWRRSWNLFKYEYKYSPSKSNAEIINKTFSDIEIQNYWRKTFFKSFYLTPSTFTWDYQWFLTIWDNDGLVIQPKVNLVKNVGFGESATHTTYVKSHLAKVEAKKITKIVHDTSKEVNKDLQDKNFHFFYAYSKKESKISIFFKRGYNLLKKIKSKIFQYQSLSIDLNNENKYKVYPPYNINNSEIGKFTYIAINSKISNTSIGKFCSIGPNFMSGWGIHPVDKLSTNPMFYSTEKQNGFSLTNKNKIIERMPIIIGNDVFIGANVTVLDGVTIGDGAIIGAGAVVSKNIPPYAIAVGCPIKIIKYRFSQDIIYSLLKIRWWDWNEDQLYNVEKYFENIEEFIRIYKPKT